MTRDEAVTSAARIYDSILADPDRRAALLEHRRATGTPAPAAQEAPRPAAGAGTKTPRRKSA